MREERKWGFGAYLRSGVSWKKKKRWEHRGRHEKNWPLYGSREKRAERKSREEVRAQRLWLNGLGEEAGRGELESIRNKPQGKGEARTLFTDQPFRRRIGGT